MSRGRILLGMLLVALGTLVWIDRIKGPHAAHDALAFFGRWWPIGLVVLGAIYLAIYLKDRWWLWGPLLIMVSGLLALWFTVRGVPTRALDFLLPTLLVTAGVVLAMTELQAPDPQRPRYIAVLRGRRMLATASEIRQGSAASFLGHLELDLTRGAFLYDRRGELDVTAIIGRVEVMVPSGWAVERHRRVEFPPELSTDDRKPADDAAVSDSVGTPHLIVNTATIFGSVEVTTVQVVAPTP